MKCTICSIKSLTTKQEIYYKFIPFQRNLLSFKCASLHFVQKVCVLNGSVTICQLNQLFSNSVAVMLSRMICCKPYHAALTICMKIEETCCWTSQDGFAYQSQIQMQGWAGCALSQHQCGRVGEPKHSGAALLKINTNNMEKKTFTIL